jgi:hypothetical protein
MHFWIMETQKNTPFRVLDCASVNDFSADNDYVAKKVTPPVINAATKKMPKNHIENL